MKLLFLIIPVLIYLVFNRKIKEKMTQLRYQIVMGSKGGFRVNSDYGYPGRFESVEEIRTRCIQLSEENDGVEICVPSKKYEDRFDHQVRIFKEEKSQFKVEILESDSQSYLYVKNVNFDELSEVLINFYQQCNDPKKYGYKLEKF